MEYFVACSDNIAGNLAGKEERILVTDETYDRGGPRYSHFGRRAGLRHSTSGLSVAILSRTTLVGPLEVRVPELVVVTKRVKVRTSSGKVVTRIRKVKKTVMRSVKACSTASSCDLLVMAGTFQPGGTEGWHSHPGVVLVGVKSGALTTYDVHCAKQIVSAGQSLVMMGPKHIMLVRNEGATTAEVLVTAIFPVGLMTTAEFRIDKPAPAGCPAG